MKNQYKLILICLLIISSADLFAAVPSLAHRARESEYHAGFYWLNLDIEKGIDTVSGNVMIRAYALVNNMDTLAVELDTTMRIDSVEADLNGGPVEEAAVARNGMEINVLLPFVLNQGDYAEVRIFYNGKPSASIYFPNSGFFENPDYNSFSASPPYNSYTWWPCKQVLTDKADSTWFFVTTDTPSIAISNGLLTGVTQVNGNQRCYAWKSHHTIDFYLISFAVGPFTETTQYFHPTGRTDSMIVEYYNYTPPYSDCVLDILQLYTNLFGPYPFYDEKFSISRVNLGGGMENQTMVVFGENGVEAHETAHQWFGDNVTCGSYDDIMLNEGFARWCESVWPEFSSYNPDSARISHCNGYEQSVIQYDGLASGYAPADTTSVIGVYGNQELYYNKNAMMLNTLRFEINNDSLFFLGLRNYQSRYGGATAFAIDLQNEMSAATGIDQTQFFNQFYYGFGYPTFNIHWNQNQTQLQFTVSETTSDPALTPFFTTYLEVEMQGTQGDTTFRLYINQDSTTVNLTVNDSITGFIVDPNQWLANGSNIIQDYAYFSNNVPSPSFRARESEYDVSFYWLDLDIEKGEDTISGNVLIRATSLLNGMDTLSVELDNTMRIDSVVADLNGGAFQPATVARNGMEVNVLLPFQVPQGQYVEARIYYQGNPSASVLTPTSGFFENGGSGSFSASPPYNSCTWFPCKQELRDKADSSWFFITTDNAWRGVSNGLLTGTVQVNANQNQWQWKTHHAIDFYQIAFAVDSFTDSVQYFHAAGSTDSVQIHYYNYSPAGNEITNILQVYTNLFGPYPFNDEKLGIASVALAGGMGNQTIIMAGQGEVEANEIAHQWFGANTTCGSWNDVMLNEGFARWCESVYPEFSSANADSARISVCNTYESNILGNDSLLSGYGPADTTRYSGVFGDPDLYSDKNAMMINTLRFTINNDSLFFLGLRNYQDSFAAGTALGSDLERIMTATTGIDLAEFFNEFYYGFGYPTFNINWSQHHYQLQFSVKEHVSDPAQTPFINTYLEVKVQGTESDTVVRLYLSQDSITVNLSVADSITGFVVDPNQWLANGPGTITEDSSIFTLPASINNLTADESIAYSVFPNPADDVLHIACNQPDYTNLKIQLYNTLGQMVFAKQVEPNTSFALPQLSNGIYTLQINGAQNFKIVIAH